MRGFLSILKINILYYQKIELARALYSNKTLILADEITANLDKKMQKKLEHCSLIWIILL